MPVMYNNMKRIVQTDTHVMILVEMNHDARIIRIDNEHDDNVESWLGESVGRWEGDHPGRDDEELRRTTTASRRARRTW